MASDNILPLTGIRGIIAQKMSESLQKTAQLSFFCDIDASALVEVDQEAVEIREKHAEDVLAQERVFEGPMGIEVDDQDRVLIVDCCKHRVQIYQRH